MPTEAYTLEEDGKFEAAGDAYTEKAYLVLSHDSITQKFDNQIGAGLRDFLHAALCYRQANYMDRCRNRCQQGVLIAEDFRLYVVEDTGRRGLLAEFIGDFKTVGRLDDNSIAYNTAIQDYIDANIAYTIEWHSNHIADKNTDFLNYVLGASDTKEPDDLELDFDFRGRVEYKMDMLDTIISNLTEETKD